MSCATWKKFLSTDNDLVSGAILILMSVTVAVLWPFPMGFAAGVLRSDGVGSIWEMWSSGFLSLSAFVVVTGVPILVIAFIWRCKEEWDAAYFRTHSHYGSVSRPPPFENV